MSAFSSLTRRGLCALGLCLAALYWLAVCSLADVSDTDRELTDEGWRQPVLPTTLTFVPPSVEYTETMNSGELVEVLAELPPLPAELRGDVRFDQEIWAKQARYRRGVWCLQMAYRPVRIVAVDVPNDNGTMDRKPVWYLIYCIKNVGGADIEQIGRDGKTEFTIGRIGGGLASTSITPGGTPYPVQGDVATVTKCDCDFCKENTVPLKVVASSLTLDAPLTLRAEEGVYQPTALDTKPISFVPQFILASDRVVVASQSEVDGDGNITRTEETTRVAYAETILQRAMEVICQREGRTAPLETSVSITKRSLAVGESVWGVAMWTDIHPRITQFSVYISGLTNAYRWQDTPDGFTASDEPGTGRQIQRKVLKLDWWRMGDEYRLNEAQIRAGWDGSSTGAVDYEWIYR